jgi:hypothetical protein
VSAVLTDGWFKRLVEQGGALPQLPGATASISIGPNEKRAQIEPHHVVLVDGRVDAAGSGLLDDADLTVLLSSHDIDIFWRGELDLPVAFMQGRAKVVGSTSVLLGLLPLLRSDAWAQLLQSTAQSG